jgi:putative SOS response-associated peptidase YedK
VRSVQAKRSAREISALFDALADAVESSPRDNIAPTQPVAAIRPEEDGRHLRMHRWCLAPSWSDDLSIGFFRTTMGRGSITTQSSRLDIISADAHVPVRWN